MNLLRSDVDAILTRERNASPEELEYIVQNAKQFCLSQSQRNEIGVRLTVAQANRDSPVIDPRTEFLIHTLHVLPTKFGLLHDYDWVQRELKAGAQAIANCRAHRPPRCQCWREARHRLWRIQDTCGPRSPEHFATLRLWESLEQMELASRPERMPGLDMSSPPIP